MRIRKQSETALACQAELATEAIYCLLNSPESLDFPGFNHKNAELFENLQHHHHFFKKNLS